MRLLNHIIFQVSTPHQIELSFVHSVYCFSRVTAKLRTS